MRMLVTEHLPRLSLSSEELDDPPASLFPHPVDDVWVEIGFGGGEHLAHMAEAHPEIGFIGSEPFMEGTAKLVAVAADRGLDNLRLWPDDARDLLERLPTASIGRCYILFPDPWPKARHHRRRIVSPETIADLARVLVPGGLLRLATDHMGYCRWMLAHLIGHPDFAWTARRPADWRERPAEAVATRYEEKARAAGRTPAFLEFRRL